MNPSEEQYFFDLATKVIANRATEKERSEFEHLLTASAEHRERFEVFKADLIVAKDIISLIDAADAKGAGLNEKQLARLQNDVERVSSQTKAGKPNRRTFLYLILLGIIITVGTLIYVSTPGTKTISKEDTETPDGIIVVTINTLNNQQ